VWSLTFDTAILKQRKQVHLWRAAEDDTMISMISMIITVSMIWYLWYRWHAAYLMILWNAGVYLAHGDGSRRYSISARTTCQLQHAWSIGPLKMSGGRLVMAWDA
jgi:hypothetical protein